MSLLSPADVLGIFAAVKSVTDTFFTIPVTVLRKGESLDRFNEDREGEKETGTQIMGLRVFKTSMDGETEFTRGGAFDFSTGYVLFNYQDVQTAGLIGEGVPMINPARDQLILMGERVRVTGVTPVGYLVTRDALVKVYFQKLLQPGS